MAVLRNKPLAEAILMAITTNSYTPSGDAIVVYYKGRKFIVTTASCSSKQDAKDKAE